MIKNTMTQKIICLMVAFLLLVDNIAYGLSPTPGSTQPGTKDAMCALGQKLFAAKNGPGAINFDSYIPGPFIGNELLRDPGARAYIGEANGYNAKFVEADYNNPPKAWKNNPILKETGLISAFRAFRDTEARIPAESLDIKEGYFPVDEEKGELPIARIEKVGKDKYVLVVHTKFVQIWNHIRKNDVWFEANLGPDDRRTISVAWGIFYRLAKHELSDLKRENSLQLKSFGHMTFYGDQVLLTKSEVMTNMIGGNYHLPNDAIWLWFLGSYSFGNTTRYNNKTFRHRMDWMLNGNGAAELKLDDEFPQLRLNKRDIEITTAFAYAINYNFFNRQGIVAPKTSVEEKLIREYEEREAARGAAKITEESIYATGQTPALDKKVTVDTLTEAVTKAVNDDFSTEVSDKEKYKELWDVFIEEHATEGMTVNIEDIKNALADKGNQSTQEIRGVRKLGVAVGALFIPMGIISLCFNLPFATVLYFEVAAIALTVSIFSYMINHYEQENFTTLASYLEKVKEDLASQAVSATEKEEIPSVAEEPPITNVTVSEEGIPEIISTHAARIGLDSGPGSTIESTTEEIASFYPVYSELNTQRIEIYLPQHVHTSITASVWDEIGALNRRIRERTGRNEDAISITPFNLYNFRAILGRKSGDVRRIFVNDASSDIWFRSLLKNTDGIDLLKGKRIITTNFTCGTDGIENSVNQMWLMKVSMLSCLLNEGNMAIVGSALKAEFEGRLEGSVNEFVNELAKEEDSQVSREAVARRINYFLGKIVKLSTFIGEQLRILKAFWIAA
ncbi:MAG: hypothetical protein Q8O01_03615 [Candidatus Omnitrophota bacterium]|nr:hypothetical protein [Candidatus Omnitrophota bacterium]